MPSLHSPLATLSPIRSDQDRWHFGIGARDPGRRTLTTTTAANDNDQLQPAHGSLSDRLRRASFVNVVTIEMQAFAEDVSPRHHHRPSPLYDVERSGGDPDPGDPDDDEAAAAAAPLLARDDLEGRPGKRRRRRSRRRNLKRLMLDGIPSNWAELLAYVALMCLCHVILRLAMVRSGLPSDQNVFKAADQFNNYLRKRRS